MEIMEGVEVISTTTNDIVKIPDASMVILLLVPCLIAIATTLVVVFWDNIKVLRNFFCPWWLSLAPIAGFIPAIIIVALTSGFLEEVGEEHIYEVSISSEVSFTELYSKYEVLGYDEPYYFIRERSSDEGTELDSSISWDNSFERGE